MIKTEKLTLGFMAVNCYIVRPEGGRECVVIDPGDRVKKIEKVIDENGLCVKAILLTHGHFDHIGAVDELKAATCAKIYIHAADAEKLTDAKKSLAAMTFFRQNTAPADVLLKGGEELDLAGMKIKVIYTPGHTKGGVCYLVENTLFSGDTLMRLSYGRTDFEDGSEEEMRASLKKLFALEGDLIICPGHGENSLLSLERAGNPILGAL